MVIGMSTLTPTAPTSHTFNGEYVCDETGRRCWFENGELHRADGAPAVVPGPDEGEPNQYWIDGIRVDTIPQYIERFSKWDSAELEYNEAHGLTILPSRSGRHQLADVA